MQKLILLVLAASLAMCACTEQVDSDFTIKVSGSSGVVFGGNYTVITAAGESTSKSVDGTVPAQYTVSGIEVSCSFENQTEGGRLKVDIVSEGEVVASAETSAGYGAVSAATQ